MKTQNIKAKVAAKVAAKKKKIAAKCGKAAKRAAVACCFAALVLAGCATAENKTPTKAQNSTQEDNVYNIYSYVGGHGASNSIPADVWARIPDAALADVVAAMFRPAVNVEIGNQAQANETSGTETMSATNTQTPTTDVKPQTTLTYGLASSTPAGAKWIDSLDQGCAKLLSSRLGSGKANGTMEVTKKDGTNEIVTCKDGICTTSTGERITCDECSL